MNESVKQSIFSALRTLLGFGAGLLVARGILTQAEALELVGAAMVLLPLAWGIINKLRSEAKTQERETVAVKAGAEAKALGAIRAPSDISPARAQTIIKTMAP